MWGGKTKKILEICREQGYDPNIAGRSLKTGRSKTILFTFSDFDRSFYLEVIHGIHDFAEAHAYDLLICTGGMCAKYMHPGMSSGCIALTGNFPRNFFAARRPPTIPSFPSTGSSTVRT